MNKTLDKIVNKYLDLIYKESKLLKVSDIRTEINWYFKEQGYGTNPKIQITKSHNKFMKILKDSTTNKKDDQLGLYNELEYACYVDYLKTKGYKVDKKIMKYCKLLKSGIWRMAIFNDKVIVCNMPKRVLLDDAKKYHSLKQPAILWHDDTGKYYIHGVRFAKDLFDKIVSRKMKIEKVLTLDNIEQRYTALRLYDMEKVFAKVPNQLLDTSEKGIELYEMTINDQKVKALKYKCPSTDREYISYVPDEIKKASEGMAWKFKMTEDEYENELKVEA